MVLYSGPTRLLPELYEAPEEREATRPESVKPNPEQAVNREQHTA
jgi:hypothetical protein